MHPSIITTRELFVELKKLASHYKNQLPLEVQYKNILDFENLMEVNCRIQPHEIIYFLTLPINSLTQYDLYYLHSMPTNHKSGFVTIIPDTRYLLKAKKEIKPLNDVCTKHSGYQCSRDILSNHKATCEEDILLQGNTKSCSYIKLQIDNNNIAFIPEINQYLAVFPQPDEIQVHNQEGVETKSLQGIYLIGQEKDTLFYKNQELSYRTVTTGQPFLLNSANFVMSETQLPNFTVNLRKLDLKNIVTNPALPIQRTTHPYHIPSIWTGFLYLSIFIIILYVMYKKYVSINPRRAEEQRKQQTAQSAPAQLHLPGEASF
jgi:hypothetical protein